MRRRRTWTQVAELVHWNANIGPDLGPPSPWEEPMKRLFGLTIAASIFSYAPPWRRSPRESSNSAS